MRWLLAFVSAALALAQAPPPKLIAIHNFQGDPDGAISSAPLVRVGKVFYGTTATGGDYGCGNGCGTVFSLAPPESSGGMWTEKIIYSFAGGNDGCSPEAGLVVGGAGVLFGTTDECGSEDQGVAFSLTPPAMPGGAWTETVLHNFGKDRVDGINPVGGLSLGPDGAFYGAAAGGGQFRNGAIYQLSPPSQARDEWTNKILYSFTGGDDGGDPITGLEIDPSSGTLYGTTNQGGTSLEGTAFSLAPPSGGETDWTEKVLYNFTGGDNGFHANSLLLAPGGILYGTSHGLHTTYGAVFSLTPPASPGGGWTFAVLHDFRGSPDGAEPTAGLVVAADWTLYGTTISGGVADHGVVFSMTPPSAGGAWSEAVVASLSGGNGPAVALTFGESGALYGTTKFGGTQGLGTVFALTLQ